MAKLNFNEISEDYKTTAPMECGMYLSDCLTEEERTRLKADWEKAGGFNKIPWWKWCYDNIKVSY